ncbi:hypothetical protein NDU88_000899 [Pleurodeles waltl]|uniref:Uncharacterized protein n=1 Tax=Pleurodeles waltl TaxID=8319 RepID=A0AAV7TGA6_PLEWA|nr:hypothetical protein NDU88_000899 [Pleurodeles waltl]
MISQKELSDLRTKKRKEKTPAPPLKVALRRSPKWRAVSPPLTTQHCICRGPLITGEPNTEQLEEIDKKGPKTLADEEQPPLVLNKKNLIPENPKLGRTLVKFVQASSPGRLILGLRPNGEHGTQTISPPFKGCEEDNTAQKSECER